MKFRASHLPACFCLLVCGSAWAAILDDRPVNRERIVSAGDAEIEGGPGGRRLMLTGMFTYMADAASIVLCRDGRRLPVSMEGDYKALEAAYLKFRPRPGDAVLVVVEGLVAERPSMEEGRPPQATLVVERFIAIRPGEDCDGDDVSAKRAGLPGDVAPQRGDEAGY